MAIPFRIAESGRGGLPDFRGRLVQSGQGCLPDCLLRFVRDCPLRHQFTRSSALTLSICLHLLPQLIRKWRGGIGTAKDNFSSRLIPKPCRPSDYDALRQNAIACDIAMICGKARPIMSSTATRIAPRSPRRARARLNREGAQMYFFGAMLEQSPSTWPDVAPSRYKGNGGGGAGR